jgi:serine/threonine-protein kinase RsbW
MYRTVSFPGSYESLAEIADFVRQAAKTAGLKDFAIYAVETAVDEACSNIIEHAYQGEGIGIIECSVKTDKQGLTIVLKDFGQPFSPKSIPDPNTKAPLEDRPAHGLGLYFMRELMDEVHFAFNEDQGNVLTLVKRKDKDSE